MGRGVVLAVVVGLLFASVSCATNDSDDGMERPGTSSPSDAVSSRSIVDVLADDGRFTTLVEFYRTNNAPVPDRDVTFFEVLDDLGGRQWTVFAPTDEAFEALGDDALEALRNGPWLTSVLHRHMVPDLLRLDDLDSGDLISDGGIIAVNVTDDEVTYGGAAVVDADIQAANGLVHAIDDVMLPVHVREDIDSG